MVGCEIVAAVYAKADSERVPGKNLRILGDAPLFWHITAAGLWCEEIDRVIVDTDSPDAALYAHVRCVETVDRPEHLATNKATGDHLAAHTAALFPAADVIVQLYPTSPFIAAESLKAGIHAVRNGWNSATGIRTERVYTWIDGKPAHDVIPSQDIAPTIVETTGFYVTRSEYIREAGRRVDPDSCFGVELSPVEAIDINYPEDWDLAEIVWKGLQCGR